MSLKDNWRATPEKRAVYVQLRDECDAAGYRRARLPLPVAHMLTLDGIPPDAQIALCRAYVAGADRKLHEQTQAHNNDQRQKARP